MAQTTYKCFIHEARPDESFPSAYNFVLVDTMEKLNQALSQPTEYMGFDTETTGLSFEKDELVGFSFCLDGKSAYYCPVKHATGGLGTPALDAIYNKMVNTKTVAMYNMRFDCRMMEYHGYTESREPWEVKIQKRFWRYDMSKVNVFDVQVATFLADTNIKFPSLKWGEKYYLGWQSVDTFEETLGGVENFYYLDPQDATFYAATDALGTYHLGIKMKTFYDEAKTSGILDNYTLYPLMKMEEETTLMDTDRLKEYSVQLEEALTAVQQRCWAKAGYHFNLGSTRDKSEVLEKLGIYTGARTKRGEMSTSKTQIEKALEMMDKADPNYEFLKDLVSYNNLTKQKSSYVDNIIKMAEENPYHPGRLRFNYKNVFVPSGRFAAGGDKKCDYFADLNIQNQPKPHVAMLFAATFDEVKEHAPHIWKAYEEGHNWHGEFEYEFKKEDGFPVNRRCFFTTCFGWMFTEIFYDSSKYPDFFPFNLGDGNEREVEGFNQHLNIRSCFCPDPGYTWVAIDFSAQELRLPALITKEPLWVNTFSSGGDLHEVVAKRIWGEENYNRDYRKMAKKANFGILYGMNEYTFADDFKISIEEAKKFVNDYKNSAPTLFGWVSRHEKSGQDKGTVYTIMGRPRRVAYYMNHPDYKMRAFGRRTCVNCYSADTEYLTRDGWKTHDMINENTVIAYFFDGEIKWCNAGEKLRNYSTESISYESRNSSWRVTPNHRMWVRTHGGKYDFITAEELLKRKSGIQVASAQCFEMGSKSIWIGEKEYSLEQVSRFLGWFMTDGSIHNRDKRAESYSVSIFQSKVQNFDEIKELFGMFGFRFREYDTKRYKSGKSLRGWCYDKFLYDWLYENVGKDKFKIRIPRFILEGDWKTRECFINSAMKGDGNWSRLNSGRFDTCSKGFADDFQILCIKTGYQCSVSSKLNRTGIMMYYCNVKKGYEKSFDNRTRANGLSQIKRETHNEECFYCFQVPSGIIVTRHNGKVSFHGNSTVQGSGADVLKTSIMRLWNTVLSKPEYHQYVSFKSTIHDEIDFQVRSDVINKILPVLIKCMRLQLPGWEFPMEVGVSMGMRWGTCCDWKFSTQTFEILHPKFDIIKPRVVEEVKEEVVEEEKPELEGLNKILYGDVDEEITF